MKNSQKVFLFYAFAYLLLFLQLPLRDALPGNTDSLMAIALSNLSWEKLCLFFHGSSRITALYPAKDVMAYGENCYGLAGIFLLFKLITTSDIWGYYFFIVTIFSLNSFAIFKLAQLFVKDAAVAILAGLVFSLSGFCFANIDDPNVIFVFFPVLSLYFLELGIRSKSKEHLIFGLCCSGIQIWFGFYVWLFQGLAILLFTLMHINELKIVQTNRSRFVAGAALVLIPAPLLLLYLYNHLHASVFSPYDNNYSIRASSLSWYHFGNVLDNNLLYKSANNIYRYLDNSGWYRLRKNAFPGFVFPLLSLLGFAQFQRKFGFYTLLFAFCFVLSFGVNLPFFNLFLKLPLGDYFRVASRLYLFALIPATLYFSLGLEFAMRILKPSNSIFKWGFLALISVFFILENVPFPLAHFEYASVIQAPKEMQEFFSHQQEPQVIIDLPTTYLGRLPDTLLVWSYSRDILYMNWQTYHHQKILGGVNSYIPKSRMENDILLQQIPEQKALLQLRKIGARFVVFHKDMILIPSENILDKLKLSANLKIKTESERLAIFEIQ